MRPHLRVRPAVTGPVTSPSPGSPVRARVTAAGRARGGVAPRRQREGKEGRQRTVQEVTSQPEQDKSQRDPVATFALVVLHELGDTWDHPAGDRDEAHRVRQAHMGRGSLSQSGRGAPRRGRLG